MAKFLNIIFRNLLFFFNGKGINVIDKVRLKLTPRFKKAKISFFNKKVEMTDASSFVSTYEEIFMQKIYAFKTESKHPLIIDCGANIGLSVIYFKSLYPESHIIAFEPDEEIFKMLRDNILNFGLTQIELHQKAVWKNNDNLFFQSQGGLSGSLVTGNLGANAISVKALRLKEIINRPIDFLKIDIEGAEYDVLIDCKEELKNVKNLFVEYHSFKNKPQVLDEILSIIKAAGFRYHIHEASVSSSPFMEIKSIQEMDLQLNIFAYR